MSRVAIIQNSFLGGELSPRLIGRTDLQEYTNSVAEMKNFYTLVHGGARRRPGTEYIGEVDDSTKKVRLIPFVFSTTQSYILVFNNGKIQFVDDVGAFVVSGSPESRTEVSHTYTEDELEEIRYTQFGATMYLVHQNHPPAQLYRNPDGSWTLEDMSFVHYAYAGQVYENAAISFKLFYTGTGFEVGDKIEITTDGSGNVSSTVETAAAGGSISNGGVGGVVVNPDLDDGVTWTIECIFVQDSIQEFEVYSETSGSPSVRTDWVADWYEDNYPAAVALYDQRLFFGGSPDNPQKIWASRVGDLTNLSFNVFDSDAFSLTIASNSYDPILNLKATRALLPMTYGGEFSVIGSSASGLGPATSQVRKHTNHGINNVEPVQVGDEVIFIQRDGLRARAITYDVALDSNIASDITIAAEHLPRPGIVDITFAQAPEETIWAIRSDGKLLSCTRSTNKGVAAWAQHETDGDFLAVASVPTGSSDKVFLCVEREIDSSTVKYIEVMDPDLYTDCTIKGTATGSPAVATTWTGLSHLEGKEVQIRADGKNHPTKTVSSGEIETNYDVTDIEVGLGFTSRLKFLPPDVNTSRGTSQGAVVGIRETVIRVQDTIGLTIDGETDPVMRAGINLDEAPEPYSGDIKKTIQGHDDRYELTLEQSLPMPVTVLACIFKLVVGE